MSRFAGFLLICAVLALLTACASPTPAPPVELPVTEIPLTGPAAQPNVEVSGLAWYGDTLIILPQYPRRFAGNGGGLVFALPRADILAFLDGANREPLVPIPVPLDAPGLPARIDGFEGYEAIAFAGDRAFLTIEAAANAGMKGYLVSGRIAPDLSALTLDTTTLVEIQPQSQVSNLSDETLIVADGVLATVYEANGAAVNPAPVAHLFDSTLTPLGAIPFPTIEYRVTDATALDSEDRFWAINYFWPGEQTLSPETDPLADRYGQGPTHARYEPVERLVEFQYSASAIRLVDAPPLQLELLPDEARNWEGLVRLDGRGFLLMTDKFPKTILGFVSLRK